MKMLVAVVVGLLVSCGNADPDYVDKLEGRVCLPMISSSDCNDSGCPRPTRGSTTIPELPLQRTIMKLNWYNNRPYSFNRSELVSESQRRVLNGSQTPCYKYADGTYSCTPRPVGYCYAHIRLGFRSEWDSEVSIITPSKYEVKTVNGAEALQVYSMGTVPSKPVTFSIECTDGSRCLEDNVTLINLQYRCSNI